MSGILLSELQLGEILSNKLLIVVALIFLISAVVGIVRGFVKIVASFAATIAIIVVVTLASPFVSNAIMKFTPIEEAVQKKCAEVLLGNRSEEEEQESDQKETSKEYTREEQISLLENTNLPELFRQMLLENNNDEIYQALGVTTFTDYVGSYLAKLLSNIAAFLLTLIVVTVIVRTILYMLGIISDLPVIGGINRLAGGVLGFGSGLLIVWIVLIAITLMYDTNLGKMCLEDIENSKFLTFLYDNNILLNFITKFRG